MRTRKIQSAFTIIELLVAMSVAVLLGFLINVLFFETTNAVSKGIATSRVINASRAANSQFFRDARGMLPPRAASAGSADGGGMLIIVNHRISGVDFNDPRFGGTYTRAEPLRSDQLLYIYDNGTDPLEPLAPSAPATFSSSTDAPFARIWYGHVLRTERGSNGATANAIGTSGSINRFGHELTLGRHVLYMDENDATAPTLVHTTGVVYNASVNGYTPGTDLAAAITSPTLRDALADISWFSYRNPLSQVVTTTGDPGRRLVGAAAENTFLENWMPFATYNTRALSMAFLADALRTNPIPEGNSYWSSQVAQGHTYFMAGVSDFIVEFAGDYNSPFDGKVDVTVSNDIIWYSHFNGGNPNPAVFATGPGSEPSPSYLAPVGAVADAAFVFRHDDVANWPHMLRIRYHLHDPKGSLTGVNEALLSNTLDDNFDGVPEDPEEAVESGKWFEVILRVNR